MNKRTTNSLAIEDFQKDNNVAFWNSLQKHFWLLGNLFSKTTGNLEDAEDVFRMR